MDRFRQITVCILLLLLAAGARAATDPLGASFLPVIDTNPAHYPANIWITDTMQKVRQDSGSPGTVHWGTFYGSQNEFIDFQVHVQAPGGGIANLTVTASNFVQSSPTGFTISAASTNVIVYREAYMNVTQATATGATYYNSTGQYPDALIPTVDPYHSQTTNAFPFNVAAGNNQSVWVDVHIPSNAPAGYYLGSVTVKSGSTTLATMPVILAVWQWPGATFMPSTSSLHFQTRAYSEDLCKQVYGVANCSSYPGSNGNDQVGSTLTQIDLGRNLLDHRIGAANYFQPGYTTSFSGLETNYGPLLNGTTSGTILSGPKITAAEYFNNTFPVTFTNVSNWATEFNTQGWFNSFIVNTFDEPSSGGNWSTVISAGATAHASTPPSPAAVTTNIANATSNSALNAIDIMIPKINDLDPRGGSLQRSAYNTWLSGNAGPTRQLWSYQSCSSAGTCSNGTTGPSTATWPNMNVDGKPAANRAMEWLTYLHGQTGELYYAVADCFADSTCTGNAPWTSVYAYGGWGDGTLFYPGDSGHVGAGVTTPLWIPSIRLKHIRDGLQDYEYLNVLKAFGQSSAVSTQIANWITNSYTFETSGTGLQSARNSLGATMHALSFTGGSGADIYVSQGGGGSGASCASPRASSSLVSGDWVAGNTIHLCGTFTSASGSTLITALGNGTSGNPITIKFEPGAVLTSPGFSGKDNGGGALVIGGHSYIVVDGGVNGIIQNTNAGTNLAHPSNFQSLAVNAGTNNVTGCTPGCRVTNLTVANMYVHIYTGIGPPDQNVDQTNNNAVTISGANGIRIDHCTFHDMGWAVSYIAAGLELDHNNIYNVDHALAAGATTTASGVLIHDNHIHDFANWDTGLCPTCNHYHHDGLHFFSNPSPLIGMQVYNNRFDGNAGINKNAWVYTEGDNREMLIFNNVFAETVIGGQDGIQPIWLNGTNTTTTSGIFNNTIYSPMTNVAGMQFFTMTGLNVKNNIVDGPNTFFYGANGTISATIASMNFNTYGPQGAGGNNSWHVGSTDTSSITTWRSASGFDANSTMNASHTVNPDGTLITGSPAISAGVNLTSLGIPALNSDIAGNARTSSGPWTVGAYSVPGPTPGLTISPNTVSFGSVNVGSSSSTTVVTVSSNGTASATLGSPVATFSDPQFSSVSAGGSPCTPGALAVGATCTLGVVFTPSSGGVKNATMLVGSNATASIGLSGTGGVVVPTMSATPSSFNFGSVQQGTSASQQFVITNTSGVNLTLASPVTSFSGTNRLDFGIPGTGDSCSSGLILRPLQTCTKTVIATPSTSSAESATATFSSTATSVSVALTVTGTAVPAPSIAISPRPVSFPSTTVGSPAGTRTLTVTNNGNVTVFLTSLPTVYYTLSGLYASDFAVTGGTCGQGTTLTVGSSCTVILSATPSQTFLEQITLSINGTASTSATVQVQGLAIGALPAPAPGGSIL